MLTKTITLIRGTNEEQYTGFQQRIWALSAQIKETLDPAKFSFTITEKSPPSVSIIPFRRKLLAALSIWGDPENIFPRISAVPGFSGFYKAKEALPVAYSKNWDDETMTPGICLLTLFQCKPGIDEQTFLDRWHNRHTPLSLKVHPLWHYNRNVVLPVGQWTSGQVNQWDGIVEEHMRERRELLNPFRFFGHPGVIIQRMIEVYRDTQSFLNYKTIEPYLVQEYHIVS